MSAHRLHRRYVLFALSFIALVVGLGLAEEHGLPKAWIGYTFLGTTVAVSLPLMDVGAPAIDVAAAE